ncbi:uncharacterized protein BDR25DRAFT_310372 [Lindgomyces ingoldianus]|uniref:Uncharacterized protein n=1 Tax=Lindgomyces ingoldianus TaxID=673940 RepID=A0ACB6RBQ0_9PLEO|nr:uncharacterized protein BDR25DRAFT_310372 [Lindgomyces ingoldianus]KAF2475947.1 hypothetical protein BDR25DRAFT_310372 [Lindgomyces ingoldianus]
MRKTRSGKGANAIRSKSTLCRQQPDRRTGPARRKATVKRARLDLEMLQGEVSEGEGVIKTNYPPHTISTDNNLQEWEETERTLSNYHGHSSPSDLGRAFSPPRTEAAPIEDTIHEGQSLALLGFAEVTEPPTGTSREALARDDSNTENIQSVVIEISHDRLVELDGERIVPLQAEHELQEDPIPGSSYRRTHRTSKRSEHGTLMPWASRKCEEEFITRYEDKFEALQMTWFNVASLSGEDGTLEALFNKFKDCLVKMGKKRKNEDTCRNATA